MVCKRQEQCVFGEKCIHHIGSVLPKCSIFEQKPPIKQTEQEYIQTCTTEQLADVFFEYRYVNATPQQQLWLSANEDFVKGGIVEWLKQPHSEVGK